MGNNDFIIWFQPLKEGLNGFYYCFDKQYKVEEIPVILKGILNEGNGFTYPKEKPNKHPVIENYYPIRLVIHSADDILKGQASESLDVFNQKNLKDENDINIVIEDKDSKRCIKIDGIKIPIIHLTLTDLYVESLFGTDSLPNPVPRSYMIMDNSIWNYLVPLADVFYVHDLVKYRQLKEKDKCIEKDKAKREAKEVFTQAVKSICNNYQNNLYRLKVAQEYADLNARLAEQSYLSGAHASGVSPFIFHSETTAKQLVQREFRLLEDADYFPFDKENNYDSNSVMDCICKHRWKILLLDDKAIEPMDTRPNITESDKSKGGWNCKLMIIKKILCNQLGLKEQIAYGPCCDDIQKKGEPRIEEKPNNKTKILIEYAPSLQDAKDALSRKKYDLVLIDYLLNQTDGTHYGYELLDEIWNDQQQHKDDEENLIYKVAPHRSQRLYCMFISAYSYAVHDRLLAEGLNQSEDYWNISLGACPTNTPQLFLYNLLKLMNKRLEDSGILKLSSKEIYKLADTIFNKEGEAIRKKANAHYQKILSLQYHYRNILKDVEIPYLKKANLYDTKGSVLMTDFIQNKINMGGLLEHLTQLVHLTAFGTVRQWHEMWEEYIYFRAQFEQQLEDVDTGIFKTLCQNIEDYIIKMKSQQ